MIVTCEACNTKFHLDPTRLRGPQSKVRCSQCGHVFKLIHQEQEEDVLDIDLADDMELAAQDPTLAFPPLRSTGPSGQQQGRPGRRLLIWLAVVTRFRRRTAGNRQLPDFRLSSQDPCRVSADVRLGKGPRHNPGFLSGEYSRRARSLWWKVRWRINQRNRSVSLSLKESSSIRPIALPSLKDVTWEMP